MTALSEMQRPFENTPKTVSSAVYGAGVIEFAECVSTAMPSRRPRRRGSCSASVRRHGMRKQNSREGTCPQFHENDGPHEETLTQRGHLLARVVPRTNVPPSEVRGCERPYTSRGTRKGLAACTPVLREQKCGNAVWPTLLAVHANNNSARPKICWAVAELPSLTACTADEPA